MIDEINQSLREFWYSIFFGSARTFELVTRMVNKTKAKRVYRASYCNFKPRHYFAKTVGLSSASLVVVSLVFALVVNLGWYNFGSANSGSFTEDFATSTNINIASTTAFVDFGNHATYLSSTSKAYVGMSNMLGGTDFGSTTNVLLDTSFNDLGEYFVLWSDYPNESTSTVRISKWIKGVGWSKMDGTAGSDKMCDNCQASEILFFNNQPYLSWVLFGDNWSAIEFSRWVPGVGWSKMDGSLGSDPVYSSTTSILSATIYAYELDPFGNPHFAWSNNGGDTHGYHTKWTPGVGWTDMNDVPGIDVLPTFFYGAGEMAVSSTGMPYLVGTIDAVKTSAFVKWTPGVGWTGMDGVAPHDVVATSGPVSTNSILLDGNDSPHIVFSGASVGLPKDVFYSRWSTALGAWTGVAEIAPGYDNISNDGNSSAGTIVYKAYFDIDSSDNPIVGWMSNADLSFHVKRGKQALGWVNFDDTSGSLPVFNGNADMVELVLGADDLPYIAWVGDPWLPQGQTIHLAHWQDGVGWSGMGGQPGSDSIDYLNNFSYWLKMALNASSTPHVLIMDNFGGADLRKVWKYDVVVPQTVESLNLSQGGVMSFSSAVLTKTDSVPAGTSIDYYLSNDGGVNWATTTPGQSLIFDSDGADLRWKAILKTDDVNISPSIANVRVDYQYIADPDVPVLISPADQLATSSSSLELSAQFIDINAGHTGTLMFEVSGTSSFSSLVSTSSSASGLNDGDNGQIAIAGLKEGATYYWRAKAVDNFGAVSPYSAIRTININCTHQYCEDFYMTDYRASTTGSNIWPGNGLLEYSIFLEDIANQAVSTKINIDDPDKYIAKATLNELHVESSSAVYFLSNDGGLTWSTTTPGEEYAFAASGNDLRWKASLHSGSITAVYLDWSTSINSLPAADGGAVIIPPIPVATTSATSTSPTATSPQVVGTTTKQDQGGNSNGNNDNGGNNNKENIIQSEEVSLPAGGPGPVISLGSKNQGVVAPVATTVTGVATTTTNTAATSSAAAPAAIATIREEQVKQIRIKQLNSNADEPLSANKYIARADRVFRSIDKKLNQLRTDKKIRVQVQQFIEPVAQVMTGAIITAEVAVVTTSGVGSQLAVAINQLGSQAGQYFNFSGLLSILGITARRKWGMIRDLRTKKGIAGVVIQLYQTQFDKLIETQVSDKYGRFSFVATPDQDVAKKLGIAEQTYYLKLVKDGYNLNKDVALASNVYYGQEITTDRLVQQGANFDIFMYATDEERFKLINYQRIFIIQLFRAIENVLHFLSPWVYVAGAGLSIFVGLIVPSLANNMILVFYLLIGLAHLAANTFTIKSYGTVKNKKTKEAVGLAVVRLYDFASKYLICTSVTGKTGSYQFLLLKGDYYITVTAPGYKEYEGQKIAVQEQGVADFDVLLEKI